MIESGNYVNVDTNSIIICNTINEVLAKDVLDAIPEFEDKNSSVFVKINSAGGDMYSSIAICSELLKIKNEVVTDISGVAYSGAFMIALTGDKRRISKLGDMMFHYPNWSTWKQSLPEHELDAVNIKKHYHRIIKELLSKTDMPFNNMISEIKKGDFFVSPQQALKFKFVDEVY